MAKKTTGATAKTDPTTRACSVARTLEVLGDRWTLLILREAFFGAHYFDEFEHRLGIATNILSQRLKHLVEHDLFERIRDKQDARRFCYRLTHRGLDLYPVTLALMNWGDRWLADPEGAPLILKHASCGHKLSPRMCCQHCGEVVDPRDVVYRARESGAPKGQKKHTRTQRRVIYPDS